MAKYKLVALSVSGAGGQVIRKYGADGKVRILSDKDFMPDAIQGLVRNEFIEVVEKEDDDEAPQLTKADFSKKYLELSGLAEHPKNWTVAKLTAEIDVLEAAAAERAEAADKYLELTENEADAEWDLEKINAEIEAFKPEE